MQKLILRIAMVLISMSLVGCVGMNDALELQNDFYADLSTTNADQLILHKDYSVSVNRGLASTHFTAQIPQGTYNPIASSSGRVFFQAPKGFVYRKNGKIESQVGGIVQVDARDSTRFYVWYFSSRQSDDFRDYLEVQPNGDWIRDVKPGIYNVASRPWIEGDFKVDLSSPSN
ncbi:hypothetical protein [Vibrio sp. SCSIO 43136]|uniref:hypothetical protein n=1 Tax=Vibrio sp. SCSIO 43136 TaxID=2819101 RepID=UPI002074C0F8|nr:hypothetical protein [Vibrio sp. SCSIO 43136]USD66407.1 hypothetical protein J4N39_06245 [Vibrio sp. SCSIO 43136]